MTQTKLVKIAIEILIHGEDVQYAYHTKKLGNGELWFDPEWGNFQYYDRNLDKGHSIYFNKDVENMAMLKVLLKDWTNKYDIISNYEEWIEKEYLF